MHDNHTHQFPPDELDPSVEPARLSAAELAVLVTWSEMQR